MSNGSAGCRVQERIDGSGYRKVIVENELLLISVLPDKGADIYEFVYKPKNVDILWKSDWGLRKPPAILSASDSQVAWLEQYEGGWQEVFPNGGAPCRYKGVELNFHGEASTLAWDCEIVSESADEAAVRFTCRTVRSPFRLSRTMKLKRAEPFMRLSETLTNLAGEEMDYMWGHHPALGAPFLNESVIIDLPDNSWIESQNREGDVTRLPQKSRSPWPVATGRNGQPVDLSVVPPVSERSADLAFIGGFDEGWYGVTNPELGFGFAMRWSKEQFPYMWLWQEFRGSAGWPWYGNAYVMALEPFTSFDESGLVHCIVSGTARTIAPGETVETELLAGCFASRTGIRKMNADGSFVLK